MADEKEESVEVTTALGKVRASGPAVYVMVMIIAMGGFLAYQQYTDNQDTKANFVGIEKRQRENVKTIIDSQQRLTDSIDIQTYMSTRTEAEKQALRLDMPEALCKRIDCNRYPVRVR